MRKCVCLSKNIILWIQNEHKWHFVIATCIQNGLMWFDEYHHHHRCLRCDTIFHCRKSNQLLMIWIHVHLLRWFFRFPSSMKTHACGGGCMMIEWKYKVVLIKWMTLFAIIHPNRCYEISISLHIVYVSEHVKSVVWVRLDVILVAFRNDIDYSFVSNWIGNKTPKQANNAVHWFSFVHIDFVQMRLN